MSNQRADEIETARLYGQQEFRKGTTLEALRMSLPADNDLATAMTEGWRSCYKANPRKFGCAREKTLRFEVTVTLTHESELSEHDVWEKVSDAIGEFVEDEPSIFSDFDVIGPIVRVVG